MVMKMFRVPLTKSLMALGLLVAATVDLNDPATRGA